MSATDILAAKSSAPRNERHNSRRGRRCVRCGLLPLSVPALASTPLAESMNLARPCSWPGWSTGKRPSWSVFSLMARTASALRQRCGWDCASVERRILNRRRVGARLPPCIEGKRQHHPRWASDTVPPLATFGGARHCPEPVETAPEDVFRNAQNVLLCLLSAEAVAAEFVAHHHVGLLRRAGVAPWGNRRSAEKRLGHRRRKRSGRPRQRLRRTRAVRRSIP